MKEIVARSMPTPNLKALEGTKGPDDDFFCHKYQVWYRVDDCVYRGQHKTFAGCISCFQGHLNMRSLEKGVRPPAFIGPGPEPAPPPEGPANEGRLIELRRIR
jgi:hypothetical protein